jgi:hypothetical protein
VFPQPRRARRAECVVFHIDLPDSGGQRHGTAAFGTVHQAEQVTAFVESLFFRALAKNGVIRR